QVTVVLSGDGGDELFCGYPTQTAHRAAEAYGRLPRLARRAVAAAAEWLPTSHRYLSFDFALRRFLRDAARPAIERHLRWMGSFPPEGQARLLAAEAQREARLADPYATAREAVAAWGPETASDVATALDLLFYLADDNLVQADRASMSVALEVRAPLLDRALAEYALRLPAVLRRGLWRTKPLLRRAARPPPPARIRRRPKPPPGVPAAPAREMVLAGVWVTPRMNGEPFLTKPPLAYWLAASVMALAGPTELARAGSALAALGTVLVTGALGMDLFGEGAGLAAAAVLATMEGFLLEARLLRADMLLVLAVSTTLWCYVRLCRGGGRAAALGLWTAVALGLLDKGLLALVLPGAAIGLAELVGGELGPRTVGARLGALRVPLGIAVVAALALPWH